jgi:hypothetical protein
MPRKEPTRCRGRRVGLGVLTGVLAVSQARQPLFTERQILPQLPHLKQLRKYGLAILSDAKLADELDEHARLQPVENPTGGAQRGGIRTPDRAMPEQHFG